MGRGVDSADAGLVTILGSSSVCLTGLVDLVTGRPEVDRFPFPIAFFLFARATAAPSFLARTLTAIAPSTRAISFGEGTTERLFPRSVSRE